MAKLKVDGTPVKVVDALADGVVYRVDVFLDTFQKILERMESLT